MGDDELMNLLYVDADVSNIWKITKKSC